MGNVRVAQCKAVTVTWCYAFNAVKCTYCTSNSYNSFVSQTYQRVSGRVGSYFLQNGNRMSAQCYKDGVNYFHPIQLPIHLVIDHDDDSEFEVSSCGRELIVADGF